MVQMLSMSLGVAASGGLLATFVDFYGHGGDHELPAFHATFICVGLMTAASAWIFWQLSPDVTTDAKKAEAPEIG
jgi:hypothetical protein